MNGDVATSVLRERGVLVPIVGLTGDTHADDMHDFLARGANEASAARARPLSRRTRLWVRPQVCTKPLPRSTLARIVDRYLRLVPL